DAALVGRLVIVVGERHADDLAPQRPGCARRGHVLHDAQGRAPDGDHLAVGPVLFVDPPQGVVPVFVLGRPGTSGETSAPTTAAGSTSISPASATWSTGCRSRRAGRPGRSRRSRRPRRPTRPARRSTWPGSRPCTTWR